jgi:predicted ATPase
VISFAVVYELLGAMLYAGFRLRRSALQPAEIHWAIAQLASIAMALPVATATIALLTHSIWAGYAAVAMAAAVLVLRHLTLSRWGGSLSDAPPPSRREA